MTYLEGRCGSVVSSSMDAGAISAYSNVVSQPFGGVLRKYIRVRPSESVRKWTFIGTMLDRPDRPRRKSDTTDFNSDQDFFLTDCAPLPDCLCRCDSVWSGWPVGIVKFASMLTIDASKSSKAVDKVRVNCWKGSVRLSLSMRPRE